MNDDTLSLIGGSVMEQIQEQARTAKEFELQVIDEQELLEMEDVISPSPQGYNNCCNKN